MQCKFCKTQNDDNAVYCQDCGKRIDGKKQCPVCGEFTNDATYCVFCGARLDGKKVCANCETVYEGAFCPECGEKQQSTKQTVKQQPLTAVAKTESVGWKKILNIIATSLLLVAVVASLVFVFFIGTKVEGLDKALESAIDIPIDIESRGIFDYFGKVYDNIDFIINNLTSNYPGNTTIIPAILVPLIIGTIVAAATLITVVILGITALVKLIQKLIGKNDVQNSGIFAIATVFAYLCGSVVFLAMDYAFATAIFSESPYISVKINISSALDGVTVAGIVVTLVLLACSVICKIATMGKELIQKPMILKFCFTAGAIVFLAIALNFAAQSASVMEYTESYNKLNIGACAFGLAAAASTSYIESYVIESSILASYSLLTIAQFVELTLLILIAATFVNKLTNLGNSKQNGKLSLSISCAAMSVVYLVFSIVGVTQYIAALDTAGNTQHLVFTFTAPIVTLVFCVVNLIAVIVFMCLKKQVAVTAPTEQLPQAE